MKNITCYSLKIWAREDHGEDSPTIMLICETLDILKSKLIEYVEEHKHMDADYPEEEEEIIYADIIDDIITDKNASPELNSIYVTDLNSVIVHLQ